MTIWIDTNNTLHDDMDGEALSLPSWPQGMTQATPEQIAATQNPAPTLAQTIATFESAVQSSLDAFAASWNYESILSAASYANSTVPQFQHEATALIAWRDQVWSACYATEAAIQAGTTPMPATPAAFLATLPPAPARPTT